MIEFGEKLKSARESKGLTQQSLADMVFVTRQTISRYESGDRYPDLITLKKLSSILNVTTDELLDDKEMPAVVERNPIIEKPLINNIIVVLYALIVFTYLLLIINATPSFSEIIESLKNDNGNVLCQMISKIGEIILLTYGFIITIQSKNNPKRTGYIILLFFFFEGVKEIGLYIVSKNLFSFVVAIPYAFGFFSSYRFFVKNDNKMLIKYGILIASFYGIFRTCFSLYTILMYADHLYTSMNSLSGFLTILIYVLFVYQTIILNNRRKQANNNQGNINY